MGCVVHGKTRRLQDWQERRRSRVRRARTGRLPAERRRQERWSSDMRIAWPAGLEA